jgi:hypothetical protein
LAHAGPAFDTILWVDRIRFVFLDLIDLARADLGTVSTARTSLRINNRIHQNPETPNVK